MRSEELASAWVCSRCGMIHEDDETDDGWGPECWGCDALDKAKDNTVYVDKLRKEIGELREELRFTKKQHKDDLKRINDILAGIKLDQKTTKEKLRFIGDDVSDHTASIKYIRNNGTPLNSDNINIIKKISRKVAIREIVKWESD
jgi:hypothetical protein